MFLPENIDLAQSEKYILSIRLTPDGFSFCIFSPVDKSVFHYQQAVFSKNLSYIENIKKTFFEVNFFSHPFQKACVTVVSPRYTVVPDVYFDKKKAKEIFEFNIHGKSGRIAENYLQESAQHVVFDLDEEVYSFLLRNLWNPSFHNHTSHLLPFFATNHSKIGVKRCFVDFHDEMISIACFSDDKLLSANTYPNKDKFEALYNIVNIWEKHPLNQNADWLFVSGDLTDNRESVDILKKLIQNVEEIKFFPSTHVAENYKDTPTDVLIQLQSTLQKP